MDKKVLIGIFICCCCCFASLIISCLSSSSISLLILMNDKSYVFYPKILEFGSYGTDFQNSVTIGEANGCTNNLSLEKAKTICSGASDCNGFFIYDRNIPSKVCFKNNLDPSKPAIPHKDNSYPNSGVYVMES